MYKSKLYVYMYVEIDDESGEAGITWCLFHVSGDRFCGFHLWDVFRSVRPVIGAVYHVFILGPGSPPDARGGGTPV